MDTPICAAREPVVVDLAPGTYYWCACGLSAKQPLCDGSHKGTPLRPVAFTVDPPADGSPTAKVTLCMCKATGTKPTCDGTHAGLPGVPDVATETVTKREKS